MMGADFVRLAFAARYCRGFGMGAAARGLAASSGSAGGAFRRRHSPGGANGKSTPPGALNIITTEFQITIAGSGTRHRPTFNTKR